MTNEAAQDISHAANKDEILWIYSMGKRFMIRGIFTTDKAANDFMEKHRDTGCIAMFGPFVIVANLYEGIVKEHEEE